MWECGHGDSVLDPPVPQYRLSMTQLDGVNCKLDNTQCELQRVDSLQTQFEGPSKVCLCHIYIYNYVFEGPSKVCLCHIYI